MRTGGVTNVLREWPVHPQSHVSHYLKQGDVLEKLMRQEIRSAGTVLKMKTSPGAKVIICATCTACPLCSSTKSWTKSTCMSIHASIRLTGIVCVATKHEHPWLLRLVKSGDQDDSGCTHPSAFVDQNDRRNILIDFDSCRKHSRMRVFYRCTEAVAKITEMVQC